MMALEHFVSAWDTNADLEAVLVEEHTPRLQEVSAVADNLDTTFWVVSVQSG